MIISGAIWKKTWTDAKLVECAQKYAAHLWAEDPFCPLHPLDGGWLLSRTPEVARAASGIVHCHEGWHCRVIQHGLQLEQLQVFQCHDSFGVPSWRLSVHQQPFSVLFRSSSQVIIILCNKGPHKKAWFYQKGEWTLAAKKCSWKITTLCFRLEVSINLDHTCIS